MTIYLWLIYMVGIFCIFEKVADATWSNLLIRKGWGPTNPSLDESLVELNGWAKQSITNGGGLYLQALRCLSQWSEQVQKEWEYRMRIEYLILQWRRIFIDPQRWAKVSLMGCALRPNRADCQDLSVVGSRNRHLALILVMRCPHRAGKLFPWLYRVLINRSTCRLQ